jgi:putative 4-mercaptohistidine N1-methyltranferase
MGKGYYETDRAVAEYLAFHYGSGQWLLPAGLNLRPALDFPVRCVTQCVKTSRLPSRARALDLGCAVGRSSFELARHCHEVIGIDFSKKFIAVARQLQRRGSVNFDLVQEGDLTQAQRAEVPAAIDRHRVRFETGDAMDLRAGLGVFDVVLLANLIDRLHDPRRCLAQLPGLIKSGGQLVITSPYTWLAEYTPRKNWLGGFNRGGRTVHTLATLKEILSPDFRLVARRDLPFLIREHARKFQFSAAEATTWIRR